MHINGGRPQVGREPQLPKARSCQDLGADRMRRMADIITHNPPGVFSPYAGDAHAVEVPPGARTLFISGLNGYGLDGKSMPSDFAGQARLVWRHLGTLLSASDMSYHDLVSLRFFLASAADDPAGTGTSSPRTSRASKRRPPSRRRGRRSKSSRRSGANRTRRSRDCGGQRGGPMLCIGVHPVPGLRRRDPPRPL